MYGQMSGTNLIVPLMAGSADTSGGLPAPLVVMGGPVTLGTGTNFIGHVSGTVNVGDITVDSVYQTSGNTYVTSGNIFIVSGNAWAGVGSTFAAGGSINTLTLGSVAVTNTVPIQGIVGDGATAIGSPILIGGIDSTGSAQSIQVASDGHIVVMQHADALALGDNVPNTRQIPVDEAGSFVTFPTAGYYFDGVAWDRIRGDSNDGLLTNLGANNDVYISGGHITLGTGTNYIGQISGNQVILGSVAVTTSPLPISGNHIGLTDRSGVSVYFDSGRYPAWRDVGSTFIASGSVNATVLGSVTVTTDPLSISGTVTITGGRVTLGTGTNYIGQVSGNQIVLGSVAVTTDPLSVSGTITITGGRVTLGTGTNFIGAVSGNQTVLGSVAITTSPVPASGPTQLYGMASGTTTWIPVMTVSGVAGAPQPIITTASVSVDTAFIASGNVYVQSGVNWTGVGSVYPVTSAAVFKGFIHNSGLTANTNIFSDLSSTGSPVATFRVNAVFSSIGLFSLQRSGATTIGTYLNEGFPLTSGAEYIFDILIDAREKVNFRYSAACSGTLRVVELGGTA